ncbi:MAG: noncanonical pyrimidine nucleotidase, YjjG family [Ruminococcaceae bacterium]|nr:noncanonical pyrimidine nucleotidase, YjjG family [Oscillospiraceae bacterium]
MKMAGKYSTVLFDADNTLLDFDKDESCALRKVMKLYGVPVTEENVSKYSEINLGMWKALERGEITKPELKRTRFRKFFDAIGFQTDADVYEVNERYLSFLAEGGNTLAGAVELCRELKEKGYDLYIVTNGIEKTQKNRLKKSGLLPFFTEIFVSEAIGHQKPKREYFDYVLSHIGEMDTEKVILVGDSLTSDIKGAVESGITCVWLNLKNQELPEEYSPDYVIRDIREAREILYEG